MSMRSNYFRFIKNNLCGSIIIMDKKAVFHAGHTSNDIYFNLGIDITQPHLFHPDALYYYGSMTYYTTDKNAFLNILKYSDNYDSFLSMLETLKTKDMLKKL